MPCRRCRWIVVLLAVVFAPFARADVAADVDALIPTEQWKQAKAVAVAALADPREHDAALDVVFNVVLESPTDFTPDEWTPWVAELRERRGAADPRARSLATLASWRAQQAFQARDREAATAAVDEALALLRNGNGRISAAEQAYVLTISGQIRGLLGNYADGAALAGEGVATLRTPRSMLERVRRLRGLFFQALFEDRLAHIDTAIALARQGIAEAEQLGAPNNGYRRRLVGVLSESLIARGEFTAVRDLMRPELERLRAQPKASPRDLAMTLGHLAEAERQLGDRELALNYYRESAQAAASDPALVASGSYAAILGNLGALAYDLKRYDEADDALGRNLSLLEKQFGGDSLRVVPALINFGELAYERNLLDEAERRFRRVLAIVATKLGDGHAEGAPALRGLARVLLRRGDAAGAAAMFKGAVAQQEAAAGTEHLQLLGWRCDLAEALAQSGDAAGAFDNALIVEQRRNRLVATVAPVLGETQALEFKRGLARCSERLLAIAASGSDARRVEAAWNEIAAARGLATRLAAQRIAYAREHADAPARERWERWSKAASAYADAVRGGGDPGALATLRRELDAAVEALGDGTPLQPLVRTPIARLRANLPEQTALVAFAAGAGASEPRLYAFVAEAGGAPRLLALGKVDALDARAERWYRLMREPGRDAELREAGVAVRSHFFDALGLAQPAGRLFVVADAGVHRLNFAALPDGGGFLVERGLRLHQLETEQDLASASNPTRDGLLLLGVPELARTDATALGRLRGSCPEFGSAFEPLPGAEREIDALARLSRAAGRDDVIALKGTAATATALRRAAPQSGIIHFATHAFEIGAGCAARAGAARRGVGLRRDDAPVADAGAALAREAGLVLSGERGGNGLLLGADVSTLALDGVGWVVLSACDTGLGARLDDEGVFGLRRAFRLAGARTVLMSLWPVDDAATSAWMEALYRARLERRRDTVDAVADADLAVLKSRRERGESPHPFYWAGFVAAGDWR
ncbi:MAG TPA: CHAT domain-containing tetratricopeptide repeat protein [Tahibacter sp.]|uniref:CHAT domain-containing protein n=1 Tax=Tahibacter sp. TaxID=2056211 RepID=UPI002BC19CA6|nr:CHAT domain-containing tetratricopeptide repeat protein [Tahibacter sp.]HSX62613.1 CHAT domain-containing tetratricopeptide repeat protein [Tahibacter sp.]